MSSEYARGAVFAHRGTGSGGRALRGVFGRARSLIAPLAGGCRAVPRRAAQDLRLRGLLWLAVLVPLFFLGCAWANSLAEARQIQTALVFDWERWIPFRPWTILPYWSVNVACAASLFGFGQATPGARRRLDRHGQRLLLCLTVGVACFLAAPLRFSYTPPRVEGLFGALFSALYAFDMPYNQLPSLHIAFLVLLRARYRLDGIGRGLFDTWVFLAGLSALTTWQHHFIDVPAGVALGFLALWCVPDEGPSLRQVWKAGRAGAGSRGSGRMPHEEACERRDAEGAGEPGGARRLPGLRPAWLYGAGSLTCFAWSVFGGAVIGTHLAGLWLVLAWGGLASGLTALIHARLGPAGFRKRNGRLEPAGRWLMLPCVLGARLNALWWTRRHRRPDHVADRIWIGPLPCGRARAWQGKGPAFDALLDLTAEMDAPPGLAVRAARRGAVVPFVRAAVPLLDFEVPAAADVAEAVRRLDALYRAGRTTLVCSALGASRSTLVVGVWLAHRSGASLDAAVAGVRRRRAETDLSREHLAAGEAALRLLRDGPERRPVVPATSPATSLIAGPEQGPACTW